MYYYNMYCKHIIYIYNVYYKYIRKKKLEYIDIESVIELQDDADTPEEACLRSLRSKDHDIASMQLVEKWSFFIPVCSLSMLYTTNTVHCSLDDKIQA